MFSDKEKKEMLADAKNISRRENLRMGKKYIRKNNSCELDDYLIFLKESQILFPHKIPPLKKGGVWLL